MKKNKKERLLDELINIILSLPTVEAQIEMCDFIFFLVGNKDKYLTGKARKLTPEKAEQTYNDFLEVKKIIHSKQWLCAFK